MSDATTALAAAQAAAASSTTASEAADFAAEKAVEVNADRVAAQTAKTQAETARDDAESFATGFGPGTATTLAPGATPTIGITGPAGAKVLNLGIPGAVADDASMEAVRANPASTFAQGLAATIGAQALTVGRLPQRAQVVVEDFASGHGWTITGGGDSTLTDGTTDYALGTRSAVASIPIASTNRDIKSPAAAYSLDLSGDVAVVVWVKISDHTRLNSFSLRASSTSGGATNYYHMRTWINHTSTSIGPTTNDRWTPIWFIPDNTENFTPSGSPDLANITDLWLRVYTNATTDATTPAEVALGGISIVQRQTVYPTGVVSFTFDDGYTCQFTNARPSLDRYGFPATLYFIAGRENAAGETLSTAQLRHLHDVCGWEIAGHALTQANHDGRLTSLTGDALEAEVRGIKQWLVENGFDSTHFAYPGGEFNDEVLEVVGRYFHTARTTTGAPSYSLMPPLDPLLINMYDPSSGGASALANAKAAIDRAVTQKTWVQFMLHHVGDAGGIAQADFDALVDYAHTKGVAVDTVSRVIEKTRPWVTPAGGALLVADLDDSAADLVDTPGSALRTAIEGIAPSQLVWAARKTASTTRNNTASRTADPDLTVTLPAGPATYEVRALLIYEAVTAADVSISWTGPSGATMNWSAGAMPSTTTAITIAKTSGVLTSIGSSATLGGVGAAAKAESRPMGTLEVGASGGAFTLNWAQAVADASDAILHPGSCLVLTKIA